MPETKQMKCLPSGTILLRRWRTGTQLLRNGTKRRVKTVFPNISHNLASLWSWSSRCSQDLLSACWTLTNKVTRTKNTSFNISLLILSYHRQIKPLAINSVKLVAKSSEKRFFAVMPPEHVAINSSEQRCGQLWQPLAATLAVSTTAVTRR